MPESSQPEDTTITNEAPVEKQETRSAVTTASTPAPAMEEQTPNLEVIRSEAKKAEKTALPPSTPSVLSTAWRPCTRT